MRDQLFRLAFFRTGSTADAEDIVHNVFLKVFADNAFFSGVDNPRGYLLRSISNACYDHLRRKQDRQHMPLEKAVLVLMPDESPETFEREYERIAGMLAEIPGEQAEIIMMKTCGGMSFADIASALDIPVATAKSRFRYGIEKIRLRVL